MADSSPVSAVPAPMATSDWGDLSLKMLSGPPKLAWVNPSGDCAVDAKAISMAATPTADTPARTVWLVSRLIAGQPF